jgi:hypothetical protein
MKKLLGIFAIFLFSQLTQATSQAGDILIWNGDTLALHSNPLETLPNIEDIHEVIFNEALRIDKQIHPEKYTTGNIELNSTGNWRGYIAEWKIINNQIFLSKIFSRGHVIDLKLIFPHLLDVNLILGDWITSDLVVPKGKCIVWINLDYKSIFESEQILSFKDGFLTKTTNFSNYYKRRSTINDTQDFICKNVRWKQLPSLNDKIIEVFLVVQPNIDGNIDSIIWNQSYILDDGKILDNMNNPFALETIRIAKLFPDWDVLIHRGKIRESVLVIFFDERHKKNCH